MASPPFRLRRRRPDPRLRGLVARLTAYEERGAPLRMAEPASAIVPFIVNTGGAFDIALGGAAPVPAGSFTSGLLAGPVRIRSPGTAFCVQADLTPAGAFRLFGPGLSALSGQLVPIGDALGRAADRLAAAVAEAACDDARLDLVEAFLLARLPDGPRPAPDLAAAWAILGREAGTTRIGDLAGRIGVSRSGLARQFRAAFGITPKEAARILRFQRALALAGGGTPWAAIAHDAGFADQAHLVREFAALAGQTPLAWTRGPGQGPAPD